MTVKQSANFIFLTFVYLTDHCALSEFRELHLHRIKTGGGPERRTHDPAPADRQPTVRRNRDQTGLTRGIWNCHLVGGVFSSCCCIDLSVRPFRIDWPCVVRPPCRRRQKKGFVSFLRTWTEGDLWSLRLMDGEVGHLSDRSQKTGCLICGRLLAL